MSQRWGAKRLRSAVMRSAVRNDVSWGVSERWICGCEGRRGMVGGLFCTFAPLAVVVVVERRSWFSSSSAGNGGGGIIVALLGSPFLQFIYNDCRLERFCQNSRAEK